LIDDNKKDTNHGYTGKLSYCEYRGCYGLNKWVKGFPILTEDNNLETKTLEVRINIEKKIIKVGELPDYESAVEADNPESIDSATPYRFYLSGLNSKTKISITKLSIVEEFDDNM